MFMTLIHFVSHRVFFFKLNFLKKTLWYHLRRPLNGSLHTLFKASGPKTHPVQNAKTIIPCLRLKNLKTIPVQWHVHFIYITLGQIKVSPSPGFAHGILQFLEVEIT